MNQSTRDGVTGVARTDKRHSRLSFFIILESEEEYLNLT